MATANDMDLTQNGIINNVHIPSSPSRIVITDEFIYDNQQTVRELINLRDSYAIWDKLTAVPAPHIYRGPGRPHQESGREQRTHLIPVDSTPKETVPSDTTLNSPSKRTLNNLGLKTDKKRLIDDDGFQTPDKRHTAKKIGKKNPSLPPTASQTSNPAQAPPHLLNRVILRLRTRILIANDEGVDEELLARAFRAALPALRKLSHPDDKACEIVQAYVALKNGHNYVAHNSA
ncbi:hypothetical protein TNCV_496711 [Trichonephila clavipes]|nr:hypothetical protein TNCV_496711 [Trichonephila clavipes]